MNNINKMNFEKIYEMNEEEFEKILTYIKHGYKRFLHTDCGKDLLRKAVEIKRRWREGWGKVGLA